MLTLSKGIEPGDWLSFCGTLFGALIGAVIAGIEYICSTSSE